MYFLDIFIILLINKWQDILFIIVIYHVYLSELSFKIIWLIFERCEKVWMYHFLFFRIIFSIQYILRSARKLA